MSSSLQIDEVSTSLIDCDSEKFSQSERESSVGARFESQVRMYPDNIAIKDGEHSLSYVQFNEAANRIANRLLNEHSAKQEQIGILMPLSIDAVVAHMAVFKTGKCCVSLDPFFPAERLRQIADDAEIEVILCRRNDVDLARSIVNREPIIIDDERTASSSTANPELTVTADTIASIVYTSGSTGRPKGVLQSHRFMLHRIWSDVQFLNITSTDRQALVNSMSFAAAWPDALAPLLNGATSYPFDLKRRDPLEFADWLRAERITILNPPITAFRQLMQQCPKDMTFPDCRAVTFAGEAGFASDRDIIRQRFSADCRLICQLASSETMLISRYDVPLHGELQPGLLPVGHAEPGMEIQIVDENRRPLPNGEIGTIVARSRYLSSGYWRREELNDAAFVGDDEVRTFYSSDTGLIRDDGMLEHRGRADFVVKLRGYRVDFTEVEAAILSTKLVKGVAVGVTERPKGRQILVAFLVAEEQDRPTTEELRSTLADIVPDYMVPSVFVYLDDLPRTFNGKLNRLALPDVSSERPELSNPFRTPESLLQDNILQIWQHVLGIDEIGIDDAFVDLGGDSLSLVQLHDEMERCLGKKIPVEQLIQAPTVRELAKVLEEERSTNAAFLLTPVSESVAARRPLFCIYGLYLYKPLAEALADHCPVYAIYMTPEIDVLKSSSDKGASQTISRDSLPGVDSLAELYADHIQSAQPLGPYQLVGSSFGGVVAFEIARKLQARGETVSLVAMLDSFAPGSRKPNSLRGWFNYLRGEIMACMPVARPARSASADELNALRRTLRDRAERGYRPQPADVDALLVRAEEPVEFPGYALDERLGWEAWVKGQLNVVDVPGDHLGILQPPNVEKLAAGLREHLDQADLSD